MTIAPFSKVAPTVAGSFVAAYVAYYAVAEAKIFGGRPASDIKTLTPQWKEEEAARFMNAVGRLNRGIEVYPLNYPVLRSSGPSPLRLVLL